MFKKIGDFFVGAWEWIKGNLPFVLLVIVILLAIGVGIVIFGSLNTVRPVAALFTPTMVASATPGSESNPTQAVATAVPAATDAPQTVVTATGMPDVGQLLGTEQVTPQVSGTITWNAIDAIPGWVKNPCLTAGINCLYVQSGKQKMLVLPNLPNMNHFVVPQGFTLVFGAFTADLNLADGKSYHETNGFYAALTENTEVSSLAVTDGFILLIPRDEGQGEYCSRVAQAMNQNWAHENVYRPQAWSDPVCTGVISTVIDPND
jgi:hypothetical protein